MKIAIITEYYYPSLGGITEHVHHFAMEAKRLGHEPVIITGDAGDDPIANHCEFEIIRIGKSVPLYSNGSIARVTVGFSVGRRIKELFRSRGFDIIHVHSPFVPTLPMLAQRYTNTVTFATFHTQFDSNIFLKIFKKLGQRAIHDLDGKIAVSEMSIESMRRYFAADFKIIPNGVDTEKFSGDHKKVPAFDDGKLNIFFLSRLEPRNGLEHLLRAFRIAKREFDGCRLIIGGDGPLKTYYKSIVPRSTKSDVHFLGKISDSRPNYYSSADIFCFPTTKASFGITILEAMASGKPVVAFSMPAYNGMIVSGEDGVLCGPPGVENLAEALIKLLESKEKRETIGKKAKVKAENYSWKKITREIINYYEEVSGLS